MDFLRIIGFEFLNSLAKYLGSMLVRTVSFGKLEIRKDNHWVNVLDEFIGWVILIAAFAGFVFLVRYFQ